MSLAERYTQAPAKVQEDLGQLLFICMDGDEVVDMRYIPLEAEDRLQEAVLEGTEQYNITKVILETPDGCWEAKTRGGSPVGEAMEIVENGSSPWRPCQR